MSESRPKSFSAPRASGAKSAFWNAAVVLAALAVGLWVLVDRRQIDWPPTRLLSALATLTGYLALAGPIVLARRDRGATGLGDMVWMTVGVLFWLYNAAALVRGKFDPTRLADPVGSIGLGLAVAAVAAAAWRLHGPGRLWTWTNVTGWILGVFWIGAGLAELIPQGR